MGARKILAAILIGIAGVLLGNIQISGYCPPAVGYVAAICMLGKNVPAAYIGVLIGMALSAPTIHFARYGFILLGIAVALNVKSFDTIGRNKGIMAMVAGTITFGVDICVFYFTNSNIPLFAMLLEGALVFALSVIYCKAIEVISEDNLSVASDNQAAIAVIILFATLLYGMPITLGGFVLAEAFALFSILCVLYKLGIGLGLAWGSVAGIVLSVMTGNSIYMTAWLPVVVVAYGLSGLLGAGRFLFAGVFSLCYLIGGNIFYSELINEHGMKSLLTALILFVFMPNVIMLKMDKRIRYDELSNTSPEWGRLILGRINNLANAFKRLDYSIAGDNSGIAFSDVGNIIEDFTNQLDYAVPVRKTIEAGIVEEMKSYEIEVKNLVFIKNENERLEVYITSRIRHGRLVTADVIRKIIEKHLGVKFVLNEESRNIVGRNYEVICMHQKTEYKCITAVRRLSKYEDVVSGDNFFVGNVGDDQMLIIIADGMGNGENAAMDSQLLIDTLNDLLTAGFDKEISIKIVNSFLANRNQGERFTTLDMLLIDLNTGYASVYKHGAETTYIKRGEWLEMIKSTSLPVGVIDGAVCEKCSKKIYKDDIVIMLSDGMIDSMIVENKEEYVRDIVMSLDYDEPEDIADEIVGRVREQNGNRLKDDATIIVAKLVKSL